MTRDYKNEFLTELRWKTSVALLLILLALVPYLVAAHDNTNNGPGTQTIETTDGYVNLDSNKVLVARYLTSTGQRTLSKRSWGLDGQHFEAEEEYLAERTAMAADLMNGVPVTFTL